MDDHDDRHDEGYDVREPSGSLEDDRVGQLNRSRVAYCLYAVLSSESVGWPDQRAQGQCRLLAQRVEIAKAHLECISRGRFQMGMRIEAEVGGLDADSRYRCASERSRENE